MVRNELSIEPLFENARSAFEPLFEKNRRRNINSFPFHLWKTTFPSTSAPPAIVRLRNLRTPFGPTKPPEKRQNQPISPSDFEIAETPPRFHNRSGTSFLRFQNRFRNRRPLVPGTRGLLFQNRFRNRKGLPRSIVKSQGRFCDFKIDFEIANRLSRSIVKSKGVSAISKSISKSQTDFPDRW